MCTNLKISETNLLQELWKLARLIIATNCMNDDQKIDRAKLNLVATNLLDKWYKVIRSIAGLIW